MMKEGIIVGIAIVIVAYALFKLVTRLIFIYRVKKYAKEFEKLSENICPKEVNVKEILDRKFGPLMEERDRLLKEQKKEL